MTALTERHAERVLALLAAPGDDITVRRASNAIGCSDDQARQAIVLLAERGVLVQINSASGVDMWESRVGAATPGCLCCGLLASRGAELPCGDCR